jgi:hypothetical protein
LGSCIASESCKVGGEPVGVGEKGMSGRGDVGKAV